ncbi:flagellar biosynthetic protein FliO [Halodesulfovibrio sp. MK-HDV]|uniref:flagellar biosynthetic protein FliO n=1 Tax=Halodesulfovibrio sp. MK-HDV TaxID=2599925 RepID=UPI00136A24A9|nr:flagellar biosynthetic protein FliO [Halodesulfovibrio sp. MK-HDV]KAF1076466.1 Flagellar protein FliO [Halodesulfovibrio sp. MK-HDV]
MHNIFVTAAHAAIDSSGDIVNGTSPAVPEVVGWGSYVQSIGILLLLLGGLYGLLWFVRKVGMNKGFRGKKGGERTLDVEERFHLAPKKQLVVVRFLNKRLLLGVTDHQINLLSETEAEDDSSHSSDSEEFKKFMGQLRNADSDS